MDITLQLSQEFGTTLTHTTNIINLMDEGTFSYSYGLGGYAYGVSVTNMAAAYSMIARGGIYIEPLTVKYIKNIY